MNQENVKLLNINAFPSNFYITSIIRRIASVDFCYVTAFLFRF
jgi:hypothetical protein